MRSGNGGNQAQRLLTLATVLMLAACSNAYPSTPDGRRSPFAPGYTLKLEKPHRPSAAALALSPSGGGSAEALTPFARSIDCAVSMQVMKRLIRRLADERVAAAGEEMDLAIDFYLAKARKLATGDVERSVADRMATTLKAFTADQSRAAQFAAGCIRNDPPHPETAV